MSTQPEDQPTPEKLQAMMASMAEHMTESTRFIMNLEYDFSPRSLQLIDQALPVFHPEGFSLEQGWHGYAAYTGEVVRRALGGSWTMESDGSGASLRGVGGNATIYPFLWLSKRIEAVKAGTDDSKVAAKYLKLLQSLGREGEAPELIAANFVAEQAEKDGGPASQSLEDSSDSDDDEESDDDDESFGVEVLHAAPTICFFMVSAADGKIDKKEIKSFLVEVVKYSTHPNKLVREVFGATPSRFEEFAKELMGSPVAALMKAAMIRKMALEHYPEEAAGFFAALNEMAKNIASASGGFFGFGNKISADEKAALDLIQNLLNPPAE